MRIYIANIQAQIHFPHQGKAGCLSLSGMLRIN